jgi:hypothetical protein
VERADLTDTGNGFTDSSEAGTPSDRGRQRGLAVCRRTTWRSTLLLPALAINPNSSDPAPSFDPALLFGGACSSCAIETGSFFAGSISIDGAPSDRGRHRVLAP